MNKHKFLCLLLCIVTLCTLISCGEEPTIPEGLQACRDSDALGVTMYAPEGWTVCNVGDISAAYVSQINQTSVSLTEADMGDAASFTEYFEAHKGEFAYEITLTTAVAEVTLGNADSAASFVYTFTYGGREWKTLQILALYGERFYIFTYSSYTDAYNNGEKSYYEQYYDYAKLVMDNITFRGKEQSEGAPSYEQDADGYLLVSDKKINGFLFYMHPSWSCNIDEGILQVTGADGVSVNLSEATGTGVSVRAYLLNRLQELTVFAEDLNVRVGDTYLPFPTNPEVQGSEEYRDMVTICDFADAKQAVVCEYTYTYGANEYRVLQYIAVAGNRGYVYTYTAPADAFDAHLDEVKAMADKVKFS